MYMWSSKLQMVYLEMTYDDQIRQLNTLGKDKLSENWRNNCLVIIERRRKSSCTCRNHQKL